MMALERKEKLSLEEVLPFVEMKPIKNRVKDRVKGEIKGDQIKMNSLRLQTFVTSGLSCVSCGLTGSFFAKERAKENDGYHLNLYAIKDGEEILITKDHILPKAYGGKDRLENMQTMCQLCNSKKKDLLTEEQIETLQNTDLKMYQKYLTTKGY